MYASVSELGFGSCDGPSDERERFIDVLDELDCMELLRCLFLLGGDGGGVEFILKPDKKENQRERTGKNAYWRDSHCHFRELLVLR